MAFLKTLLSTIITFQLVWLPVCYSKNANEMLSIADRVAILNAMPNLNAALALLAGNLSKADLSLLKEKLMQAGISLQDKIELTYSGDSIRARGLPHPIQVAKDRLSYQGVDLSYDFHRSLEENYRALSNKLHPKKASIFPLIPTAYADSGFGEGAGGKILEVSHLLILILSIVLVLVGVSYGVAILGTLGNPVGPAEAGEIAPSLKSIHCTPPGTFKMHYTDNSSITLRYDMKENKFVASRSNGKQTTPIPESALKGIEQFPKAPAILGKCPDAKELQKLNSQLQGSRLPSAPAIKQGDGSTAPAD